ncbi:hypothetical protein AAFF_G00157940 [Aldrovandia affinis]|uniref:Uncharacterized protein n=1 Tax=Aldrovandia affinis TaxID=143900 RepID=A0AAD7W8F4_9TELE|nr:hypothetical protein AAFF_G00157940 [Aldrovandia affinis]
MAIESALLKFQSKDELLAWQYRRAHGLTSRACIGMAILLLDSAMQYKRRESCSSPLPPSYGRTSCVLCLGKEHAQLTLSMTATCDACYALDITALYPSHALFGGCGTWGNYPPHIADTHSNRRGEEDVAHHSSNPPSSLPLAQGP